MENKNSKEELIAINVKKSREQVPIDQSELFPHQSGVTHTEESNPVEIISSHPLPASPARDNQKREVDHTALSQHTVKHPSPDIIRKAKNIILELIELNEPGSIQIQNFASTPAKSSQTKTIPYITNPDETDNDSKKSHQEMKRNTPVSSIGNGNTYIPRDILKRSFGSSKFFTGSPRQT